MKKNPSVLCQELQIIKLHISFQDDVVGKETQVKDDLLSICHAGGQALDAWEAGNLEETAQRLTDNFVEMSNNVMRFKARYVDAQINYAVSEMHRQDLADQLGAIHSEYFQELLFLNFNFGRSWLF